MECNQRTVAVQSRRNARVKPKSKVHVQTDQNSVQTATEINMGDLGTPIHTIIETELGGLGTPIVQVTETKEGDLGVPTQPWVPQRVQDHGGLASHVIKVRREGQGWAPQALV